MKVVGKVPSPADIKKLLVRKSRECRNGPPAGHLRALGLGIWTAVQPCPMATNVAAISYLGRRVDSPRWVLLAGLLYALGRTLAYVVLAVLVVESLQASRVSIFLQTASVSWSDRC